MMGLQSPQAAPIVAAARTRGSQRTFLMPSWRSSSASISWRVMCGFLFLFRRHSAVVTIVLRCKCRQLTLACQVNDTTTCLERVGLTPGPGQLMEFVDSTAARLLTSNPLSMIAALDCPEAHGEIRMQMCRTQKHPSRLQTGIWYEHQTPPFTICVHRATLQYHV